MLLTGPRKAKEKALKDACEYFLQSLHPLKTYMLAWYEAQGKKRPRSPNADNSENERYQGKSQARAFIDQESMRVTTHKH